MPDPNVMANSVLEGMLNGINVVISSIPWWLWLIVVVLATLKPVMKKKSRRRRLDL